VYTEFEDFNLFVYHASRGLVFDGVIWCLGPYVDDSVEYGRTRIALARFTRYAVRRWCGIGD
jgi:hypothetical protein